MYDKVSMMEMGKAGVRFLVVQAKEDAKRYREVLDNTWLMFPSVRENREVILLAIRRAIKESEEKGYDRALLAIYSYIPEFVARDWFDHSVLDEVLSSTLRKIESGEVFCIEVDSDKLSREKAGLKQAIAEKDTTIKSLSEHFAAVQAVNKKLEAQNKKLEVSLRALLEKSAPRAKPPAAALKQ